MNNSDKALKSLQPNAKVSSCCRTMAEDLTPDQKREALRAVEKRIEAAEKRIEEEQQARQAAEAEAEVLRQVSAVLVEAERRLRLMPKRTCSYQALHLH
jgi:hypothetical protein